MLSRWDPFNRPISPSLRSRDKARQCKHLGIYHQRRLCTPVLSRMAHLEDPLRGGTPTALPFDPVVHPPAADHSNHCARARIDNRTTRGALRREYRR